MLFCEVRPYLATVLWCTDRVLSGYTWDELPKGSLVVDVGGGVGNVTKVIAKAFPDLKYVVQDRAATIEEAVKVRDILYYCSLETMSNLRTPIIALGSGRSRHDLVRTCDPAG